jgi:uncharacterized membrane protein YqjE
MSQNGESKKSITGEVLSLLEDHMELASLEWEYEKTQTKRRLGALAVIALLAMSAFAFLQIAIVYGLVALGLTFPLASLVLAGTYLIIAAILCSTMGKRDKRAGEPFQGTRQEIRRNIKWIRQIFS